jgi:hypothetical protein
MVSKRVDNNKQSHNSGPSQHIGCPLRAGNRRLLRRGAGLCSAGDLLSLAVGSLHQTARPFAHKCAWGAQIWVVAKIRCRRGRPRRWPGQGLDRSLFSHTLLPRSVYTAPEPRKTAGIVQNSILISSQTDHCSMYRISNAIHSSKPIELRPITCQRQVIPGFTLNLLL